MAGADDRLRALLADAPAPRRVRVATGDAPPRDAHGCDCHPTATLIVALAGVVRVETARERFDLLPGEALAVAPGTWHRHAPLRAGAACVQQGVVARGSDVFVHDRGATVAALLPREPSATLLARLCDRRDGRDEAARARLVGRLLAEIAASAIALTGAHPAVVRMEDFLRVHRLRRIGAADVVRAAGLGRTRAHALFRAWTGLGIKQALTRDRLAIARALLRGPLPIGEVARRSGFADLRDLGRACRRAFGAGPRALRREAQREDGAREARGGARAGKNAPDRATARR